MLPIKELKGAAAMKAIGRIVAPLSRMASDKETMGAIAKAGTDDTAKAFEVLTDKHSEDLLAVLAACNGMTVEEYEDEATLERIVADFAAIVSDEAVIGFLSGALQGGVRGATASPSASTAA